ncbi:hypothetical protein K3495_g6361 [Podosphaera aphanis]|nr:hypothetical protein K3495_g6361 [Podosphaera aphanis]
MLSVQKAPKTCLLCRQQLFSQFKPLFFTRIQLVPYRPTYSTRSHGKIRINPHHYINPAGLRCISTEPAEKVINGQPDDTPLKDDTSKEDYIEIEDTEVEAETIVRQARLSFGDTLPKGYLTAEEYKLYERFYGPPIRETTGEDLEFIPKDVDISSKKPQNVLLRTNNEMELEEVEYNLNDETSTASISKVIVVSGKEHPSVANMTEESHRENREVSETDAKKTTENILYAARNQREADAMERLLKDMKEAEDQPSEEIAEEEEYVEEEEEEEEPREELEEEDEEDPYVSSDTTRTHPHTMAGRSRSNPSTIYLPNKSFIGPITGMLSRTKPKHLQIAAEKAFGGKWLPYSSSVPSSTKQLPQKEIGLSALQYNMSEIEADAYISAVMPGVYVSIMSILIEIRKRLGQKWLRDLITRDDIGPRVLDVGSGGAGIVAWRKIMEAEWETMKDEGIVKGDFTSPGTSSVVVGSDCLRHRASKLLDNTTFLPRLPNYIHASNLDKEAEDEGSKGGRKVYDVIIAPHTLLPQKENYKRKDIIKNLWTLLNSKGGVLIILEKGIPRGFEAIAGARSLVLDKLIASPGSIFANKDLDSTETELEQLVEKEEGMIIAPCTNHTKCPMYPVPGLSSGRKDYCYFPQRFIRPAFLQRLIGSKSRNHEDVKFSYVAFRRGIDARKGTHTVLTGDEATMQAFEGYESHDLPESHQGEDYMKSNITFNVLSLPRAIFSPLKRHGHVTLDLCTPSGKLERWTVPKSFSKAAYRDARKSKWGDLWALGAKTRVPRNVRLGNVTGPSGSGISSGQERSPEKRKKKEKYDTLREKGFEKDSKQFLKKRQKVEDH